MEKNFWRDSWKIEEIHSFYEKIEFYLIERSFTNNINLAEERLVDLIQKLSINKDFEINSDIQNWSWDFSQDNSDDWERTGNIEIENVVRELIDLGQKQSLIFWFLFVISALDDSKTVFNYLKLHKEEIFMNFKKDVIK